MPRSAASIDQLPFRFLDLPKELRLRVYEYLSVITTKIHRVEFRLSCTAHLVVPKWMTPIHLTCKVIQAETIVLLKKLEGQTATPRLAFKFDALSKLPQVRASADFAASVALVLSKDLPSTLLHTVPDYAVALFFRDLALNETGIAKLNTFLQRSFRECSFRGNSNIVLKIALQGSPLTGIEVGHIVNEFARYLDHSPSIGAVKILSAAYTEAGSGTTPLSMAMFDGVIDEGTWNCVWA